MFVILNTGGQKKNPAVTYFPAPPSHQVIKSKVDKHGDNLFLQMKVNHFTCNLKSKLVQSLYIT